MAEAIFNHKIKQLDLHTWGAFSAGTGNYHIGDRPDDRTLAVLESKGIESISRAQNISSYDPDQFNYWVAMDENNRQDTLSYYPEIGEKLVLMREFDSLAPGQPVPDPYWGGAEEFEEVFNILDRSIDQFVDHIRSFPK